MVLKHLQSTTEPRTHRSEIALYVCVHTIYKINQGWIFPQEVLLTGFAGHSHHAFLLLPKADVILESQEIKKELKNKHTTNWNMFIIFSPLNRQNWKHLSLWFRFYERAFTHM